MKFCVIGVGRFGYHVATTLAENGMDVIAVDSNESIIASIRDKVTQAICMRVVDEESLHSIGIDEIDTVIVAMGENFAQSILITAILKQKLKISNVITRSISKIHQDILQLIGADQVILPEQEVGIRLADNLSLPFKSVIRISSNFSISKLQVPKNFVGKTIKELEIETDHNVKCIARKENDQFIPIEENYIIKLFDILIFSGTNKDLAKLAKLN